jgi:hypothetical protein
MTARELAKHAAKHFWSNIVTPGDAPALEHGPASPPCQFAWVFAFRSYACGVRLEGCRRWVELTVYNRKGEQLLVASSRGPNQVREVIDLTDA